MSLGSNMKYVFIANVIFAIIMVVLYFVNVLTLPILVFGLIGGFAIFAYNYIALRRG
ncbi:MAG: hypothetical protein ACFE7E_07510 [Candidatus Hodarchaeota archaeon]